MFATQDDGAAFGDIMGSVPGSISAPVALMDFEPLHRLVLTSNGNLQRIISALHDVLVRVRLGYNREVAEGRFERQVSLCMHHKEVDSADPAAEEVVFGVATSNVSISRQDCLDALKKRSTAIGQLFRVHGILPHFELHGAAYEGEANERYLCRTYSLTADGIACRIHERLCCDVLQLHGPRPAAAPVVAPAAAPVVPGFGDIMCRDSASTTGLELPACTPFSGMERLLLTANGNIGRLVSAFYAAPTTTVVTQNAMRASGCIASADSSVWDRQVTLLVRGSPFMDAKSTVFITDREWAERVAQDGLELGALFRVMGVLPTFDLRSVGRSTACFWRTYTLSCPGMTAEITETFALDTFDRKQGSGGDLPVGEPLKLADLPEMEM